jgi:hypothetical protein
MLRRRWVLVTLGFLALVLVVGSVFVLREMRTSDLQARYLVPVAQEATWWMEEGPAGEVVEPGAGPYDLRLGYHGLPARVERLQGRGFRVVAQARTSARFRSLTEEHHLFPIYRSKAQAGLTIVDRDGEFLFHHPYPELIYPEFHDVPPVVWQTLLFIENRTALDPEYPHRNPAVEWGRLFRSTTDLGLRYLGREGSVAGASTLATQIEKFRHAPEGLTESPMDKLRQMASAALRAYQDGPETMEARQRMVRDYLNSVPLAAIRVEGEITGLGDGLRAWYGADFAEVNRALHPVPTRRVGAIPGGVELLGTTWPGGLVARGKGGGLPSGEEAPSPGPPRPGRRPSSGWPRAPTGTVPPPPPPTWGWPTGRSCPSSSPSGDPRGTSPPRRGGRPWSDSRTGTWTSWSGMGSFRTGWPRPPARLARSSGCSRRSGPVSFVERKAVNTVRTGLLGLLDVPRLYDLDRMDLRAEHHRRRRPAHRHHPGGNLQDPAFIRERGFDGFRLLDRGDPQEVIYSIALHERTPRATWSGSRWTTWTLPST